MIASTNSLEILTCTLHAVRSAGVVTFSILSSCESILIKTVSLQKLSSGPRLLVSLRPFGHFDCQPLVESRWMTASPVRNASLLVECQPSPKIYKGPPNRLDIFIPSRTSSAIARRSLICFYLPPPPTLTPHILFAMISVAALIPVVLMLQASALTIPFDNKQLGVSVVTTVHDL